MPAINSATGQKLAQDPARTLMLFLRDNWVITDPPIERIIFDTKYRNIGSLNGIFVKRRQTPSFHNVVGPARQNFEETFDMVIYARGDNADNFKTNSADDQIWKIKERVKSLINANIDYNLSNGIEHQWCESFTIVPASTNLAQVLSGQSDPSRIRLYIGRVKLRYDMTFAPAEVPISNTPPPLKSLVLTRLETGWTENPCKSIIDHLFSQWTALDPAKGATKENGVVVFLRSFADAGLSLYKIVVRPESETSICQVGGQPVRDQTKQIMKVDIFCKNTLAHDKRWKIEQEVRQILQSDVTALWSKGIEEFYLQDFAYNEDESEAELARHIASASYYSFGTARLVLEYTLEAIN